MALRYFRASTFSIVALSHLLPTLSICSLLVVPHLIIVIQLFGPRSSDWLHIVEYLLPAYVLNTCEIVAGVLPISFFLGYVSAWCIGTFDFPGRNILKRALMLPISVPTYVAAYAYYGMFGSAVVGKWGIIFIFSVVLYPYIYLFCLAGFSRESRTLIETARSLGSRTFDVFRRVQFPMSRPALISGLWLVCMDTVNDYGAVDFFGINTITTGVFVVRENFDISESGRFCAWLLVLMLLIRGVEDWTRGKRSFSDGHNYVARRRIRMGVVTGVVAVLALLVPIVAGFIIPAISCLKWTVQFSNAADWKHALEITLRTVLLAASASVLVVCVGLYLSWSCRVRRDPLLHLLVRVCQTGYVVPGVVIGISVMTMLLAIDRVIVPIFSYFSMFSSSTFLYGTYFTLVFAYCVRFVAMSITACDAAFLRLGMLVHEAARSLGKSPLQALFLVEIPSIRPTLLIAFGLLFVELVKELPLTMLLAPPDFGTLATLTHMHMKNEDIIVPAIYSSIIMSIGIFSSFLLWTRTGPETDNVSESRQNN